MTRRYPQDILDNIKQRAVTKQELGGDPRQYVERELNRILDQAEPLADLLTEIDNGSAVLFDEHNEKFEQWAFDMDIALKTERVNLRMSNVSMIVYRFNVINVSAVKLYLEG